MGSTQQQDPTAPNHAARRASVVRGTTTASRPRIGRAGPRSRAGCTTCKQRRVRCDEAHPTCGHCDRLQLECLYKPPPQQRWKRRQDSITGSAVSEAGDAETQQPRAGSFTQEPLYPGGAGNAHAQPQSRSNGHIAFENGVGIEYLSGSPSLQPQYGQRGQDGPGAYNLPSPYAYGFYPRSGHVTPNSRRLASGLPLAQVRRFDINDIFSDLNTSWAGEISCVLPDMGSPENASSYPLATTNGNAAAAANNSAIEDTHMAGTTTNGNSFISLQPPSNSQQYPVQPPNLEQSQAVDHSTGGRQTSSHSHQTARRTSTVSYSSTYPETRENRVNGDGSAHLMHLFRRIVQPPAAILIGGTERWRRLQRYLCKLSDQSRAVHNSLLAVIELLLIEDTVRENGGDQEREACMARILKRHADACQELERKVAKHADCKPKTREHLLAAIFLLSWFEVIRDQDSSHSTLFPRHIADTIITSDTTWSRQSQQLLSWLNTLDSKATHLGGQHLLLPKSLEVVSHYPTQITSEQCEDGNDKEHQEDSELSADDPSPESYHSPLEGMSSYPPMLKMGRVKHIMLNTLVQPALNWYLITQSYCRRISAHDKHHRRRLTSDDEYEVITSCKQLESELFELWDYRPAIISVHAEQLAAIVSPDVATRLEEILSVYLASYWILFVYLHRVSWWNLPHSALTSRALDEVWQHLQRAYGEEVNGPLRRIIHPSLLWPLFLFGSECSDPNQRAWAIEQLEALGEAKPVINCDDQDTEMLPQFKLGFGATRNAKRAATLLRELIKQQDEKQARVDDRDLSIKLFGCYFSIV